MATKYPPYVNAYGTISKLFGKIKEAAVPPKFTYDYLKTVLGFKSSSATALIPLLKKLGFLDPGSVPTQAYKDYRKDSESGRVMARMIREAYKDLYQPNEYAHRLQPKELKDNLISVLGVEKTDPTIAAVVGTFGELIKLANFDDQQTADEPVADEQQIKKAEAQNTKILSSESAFGERPKLGISYTINLNLPPTTEIQVFDAIFKSLRANILDQE